MTSKLSAQSKERYREFQGQVVEQMPLLMSGKNEKGEVVDVPRNPASFAYIIELRETAPKDMHRKYTSESFFTGDTVSRGVNGDLLSTWDSPILRTVNPKSTLINGALKLSTVQWDELRAQKDGTLYLSADEVEENSMVGDM